MQASQDIGLGTGYVPSNIGHVFGRMGVGARTTPGSSSAVGAFQWTTPSTIHGMMLSLFPSDPTQSSGLIDTQTINIEASAVEFTNLATIIAPVQPAAALDPIQEGHAWLLKASSIFTLGLIVT